MNQRSLFDTILAREEREGAIDLVESSQAAEDWQEIAKTAVLETAKAVETFTTDDVLRRHPELEGIPEAAAGRGYAILDQLP